MVTRTRINTHTQFLPTPHSLHAYRLLALFQLTSFTVNEPVATFPSLIAICYLLILAAILIIAIACSKIKREVTKPEKIMHVLLLYFTDARAC